MSGIGPSSRRKAIRRRVTREARSRPLRRRMRLRFRRQRLFGIPRRQLRWRKPRNKITSQFFHSARTSHGHAQFFHLEGSAVVNQVALDFGLGVIAREAVVGVYSRRNVI